MARLRKPPQDRSSAPYDVGYGKPPASSRFKPGRSGNPGGRPKGAKNTRPGLSEERLKGVILDEAYRMIKVAEGGREVSIPMAQAVVRAIAVNAARGQHRAQALFAELLGETERANKALQDAYLEEAIKYKMHWEEVLERRQRLGISGPEPLPHPDDVVIDLQRGEVIIKGPMTKEEKVKWDRLYEAVERCDAELAFLEKALAEENSPRGRELIESDIAFQKKLRAFVTAKVGEPKDRRR